MTQQINLINPDLQPRHDWLAFKSVALATGVAAALVTIFSVYATISAGSALSAQQQASERLAAKQQELEGVQATLAARKGDPALDQEIERLKQEVAARREVLRLAEESATTGGAGFADMMRGFSRQAMDGVWLSGFTISGAGIDIRGRLLDPSLLPAYIARLNAEPAFRGRRFAALDMADVAPKPVDASPAVAGGMPAPKVTPVAAPRFTEFALRAAILKDGGGKE